MEIDKLTVQKRGRLGEKLVEACINDDLIPSLKKTEGWTNIIYTVAWFKATYPQKDYEDFIKFEEENKQGFSLQTDSIRQKNSLITSTN